MNIREILNTNLKEEKDSTEYIISKIILETVNKNLKLSLTDISNRTYISKSSIVKFCQKLGFSGFSEFANVLSIENKYAYKDSELLPIKSSEILKEFNSKIYKEIEFIQKYINEFEWLSSNIKKFSQIYIYGSEENDQLCRTLVDYLMMLNIDVKYSNFRAQYMFPNFFKKTDLIIFIISGIKNEKCKYIYDLALEYNTKIFTISTESQIDKFNESNHKIIVRYLDFFPWYQSRILIFIYTINLIIYFINHKHSDFYQLLYNPKIKY